MSMQAQDTGIGQGVGGIGQPGAQAPPGAAVTPQTSPTPVAAPSAPHATPQTSPPAPAGGPISADRRPTRVLADDDALPEDADTYEISRASLKRRLERYGKQHMLKSFGTDDPDQILLWKQQAEAAAAREEEQRLSQMTEAEKYKSQMEKFQSQANHWKTQYETLQESHQLAEQDRHVMDMMGKHVKSKCLSFVSSEYARHLNELAPEEMPQDAEAYTEQWVSQYVQENPEFGNAAAPAQPQGNVQQLTGAPGQGGTSPGGQNGAQAGGPPAPRQVQVPFSNGAGAHNRPPPNAQQPYGNNKTAAPGQPNSMSDSEWREYKRSLGYSF